MSRQGLETHRDLQAVTFKREEAPNWQQEVPGARWFKADLHVQGDADMVIQLEATADRGRVACAGAIDDPAVRDAIVRTVDGGREAFRLRRRKYGF